MSDSISVGENVKMTVTPEKVILELDMKHRGSLSPSGKSTRVASTLGNTVIPGHPGIKLGLNAFDESLRG